MSPRESFPPSTSVCPANDHFHGDGGNRTHASFPPSRPALTRGERRLLDWLTRFDFTGKGCYPTRAELAERCGYTEEYVSALVKGLREKEYITVTKRRRPGCQYAHNVYRVRDWSPNVRRGVCNLRADFVARRAAREANQAAEESADLAAPISSSYLERTATATKGSYLSGTPSLRASKALPARSQARARRDFGLRRSSMEQSRRHLHVADLTCLHCTEKDAEIAELRGIRETLQRELNRSMENEAGALAAAKAAGNALNAAKGQLTREQKKSAKAGQVQLVVDHWRLLRPRTGPEFGEPGSKSFTVIEKALVLMANDPVGAVAACCEAIDGLHMAPWWSYGKRYATPGEGRSLKRDLEHALGDEQRIVKCRGIVKWMRAGGVERTWEVYLAVQETESVLRAEVLDLLGEQRFRREEPAEWCFVDGARTRLDEKGTRSE